MTVAVSWEQALAWRMRRQHLVAPAPASRLVAVVDRMGALHAQLMSSVELALWARTEGLTRDAVTDALWRQRTLVKLWAMRKTLHVFASSSLGSWLAGLGTFRRGSPWYGLRDPLLLELAELIGTALHDRLLTRAELATEVGRLSGSAEMAQLVRGGWGSSLKPASFLGRLCFGPGDGPWVRFTHPATWLPEPPEPVPAAEALAAIAASFLGAYGPAAAPDLAAWWGERRTAADRMIAALGSAATRVSVDGEPYWMLTEHVAEMAAAPPVGGVVRLLPAFDPWVVCAARRDGSGSRPGPGLPALDPEHRTRIYRLQGWVSPVLLVDGRIAGVWRHHRAGRRLEVEVEPFGALPRRLRRPVEEEVERLTAFLGGDLRLAWAG